MASVTRIEITKDHDALIPGDPRHVGSGTHRPYELDSPLIVPHTNGLIGKHEHCGGDLRYIQISTCMGVIACQGGCNLRVRVRWQMRDYQALINSFHTLNFPPATPHPDRTRPRG